MITEPGYGGSNHYLGTEGERYFAWQNSRANIGGRIEALKFRAHIKPSDCVLDFGCAAGFTLKNLQCARRLGVEINPAARRAAVETGIEVYATAAEVPDGVADVVISNHALEHVPYPVEALRQLRAKLKPAGELVLVLPLDDWRTQKVYDPADINHHLHTWTPQLLGNTMQEAGFDPRNIQIRVFTHAWFPGSHSCFGKIPQGLFDGLCWIFATMIRRRQLIAVYQSA
jgi:SAM-dependent methyltransferase